MKDKANSIESISIAAPVYNGDSEIAEIIYGWIDHLKQLSFLTGFEIVVCNDGSLDQTAAILDQISRTDNRVVPVHLLQNQGAAAALYSAIRHARHQWVLLIDSDGQYDIRSLDKLIDAINATDAKAAIGVRATKSDNFIVSLGSRCSGWLCNFFHNTKFKDFNCALKLIERSTLLSLPLEAKGLNYSGDVLSKLIERAVTIVEVEVEHSPRKKGSSSAKSPRAMWHRLLFVLYIGFRQFLIHQKVLQIQSQIAAQESHH